MRKLKIGLLGCGTVGGGFVRLLEQNRELIQRRAEAELQITRILVRDAAKERPGVDRSLLTTHAEDVVRNGADVDVGPRALPPDHPLAAVRGEQNGVVVETDAAGELTFYGPGAGSLPSASAVLADVVEIARS